MEPKDRLWYLLIGKRHNMWSSPKRLDTSIYITVNIGTIKKLRSINIMELSNRTQQVAHQS
jgi:hypothetical protein